MGITVLTVLLGGVLACRRWDPYWHDGDQMSISLQLWVSFVSESPSSSEPAEISGNTTKRTLEIHFRQGKIIFIALTGTREDRQRIELRATRRKDFCPMKKNVCKGLAVNGTGRKWQVRECRHFSNSARGYNKYASAVRPRAYRT